jgi:GMC oxidoreductase
MLPLSQGGVVDANLRVYGLSNVRVADASVPPIVFAAHLMSSTYGLAEQASTMIRAFYNGVAKKPSNSTSAHSSASSSVASSTVSTSSSTSTALPISHAAHHSLSGGAGAGIAIGVIALLAAVGAAAVYFFILPRRRRQRSKSVKDDSSMSDFAATTAPSMEGDTLLSDFTPAAAAATSPLKKVDTVVSVQETEAEEGSKTTPLG